MGHRDGSGLPKPLAEAHVAWCEHAKFRNYCNHVFDFAANDAGIGVAFTQTMSLCYAGVQDKVTCWEHIKKWLEDDLKKPEDNLIVAAMLLGNRQALAHVQQAAQARTDPRSIPWDSGIRALSEMAVSTEGGVNAVEKVLSDRATETMKDAATAQLTAEFSGPLAAVMRSAASTKTLTAGPIAAGMASGQAIIPVVIQGYLGGHITSRLTFAIRQAYPFLNEVEVSGMVVQAIDGKLNVAYRQATHERAFMVHVTPKKIPEIPKELHIGKELPGGKPVCDWLLEHGLSAPQEIGVRVPSPGTTGEMAPLKVERKAPGSAKDSHWTQPEGRLGMTNAVLCTVLAFVGWWQLNDEAKKAQGAEIETANSKLNFQICAATGAAMDTMGKVMSTVLSKTVASGAIARKCIAFLKVGGTALGAVAGFAAAYYEYKKRDEDRRLNNKGLATAHLISAGVGGTAAVLSLAALFSTSSLIPIAGWALAAAGLITLVVIEEMTDKIGDWLKQCSWGAIRFGDRFLTLEAEVNALKGAATT